ncbi:MAG: hypothetical protein PHX65_05845, partial [Sulfurimonas sp.]|nr:hypothetical protein [Sulfurimonas sp.]
MFNFIKNIFIDKTISEKEKKSTESSLTTNKLEKISEQYKKDEMNSIKDEYANNTYQNNPETYSI